jgi:hypothetical protein
VQQDASAKAYTHQIWVRTSKQLQKDSCSSTSTSTSSPAGAQLSCYYNWEQRHSLEGMIPKQALSSPSGISGMAASEQWQQYMSQPRGPVVAFATGSHLHNNNRSLQYARRPVAEPLLSKLTLAASDPAAAAAAKREAVQLSLAVTRSGMLQQLTEYADKEAGRLLQDYKRRTAEQVCVCARAQLWL